MKHRTYLRKDKFWTFDIETTTLITGIDAERNPIRNAIIWSGQFYDGTDYIQTRNLEDTIKRLKLIGEYNREESDHKILCVVHNLSYEFQFIKDFFDFEKVLCTSTRKIISAETKDIVFRCSYFLSNMGLEKFLENERVPEEFQKTNMDYLVERYPWTEIDEDDYIYCKNDVVGLHKAVESRIKHCFNEDVNNLPLTSTGYVRKDCRAAVNGNKSNRYRFKREALDKETYIMCHAAFRGGNTHANRYYVNRTLGKNEKIGNGNGVYQNIGVGSEDERSEYPAAALLYDMPTKFFDLKPFKQKEFDFYLANWEKWGMLIDVTWRHIKLKDPKNTPVPYLSCSKCDPLEFYNDSNKTKKALQVDNGRILKARTCHTIITEFDYMIIKSQYKWKKEKISRVKVTKKKPICKELKDKILEYFYKKTTLKQDEGDPNFDENIDYMYRQSKSNLNGIYGMAATCPCKNDYHFDTETHMVVEDVRDEAVLLDEFYNSFSSFLSYQYGVWITAAARWMLQEAIDLLGSKQKVRASGKSKISDMVYCDTDSVKFLNPADHKADIEALNRKREQRAEERGAYIDYEGKRYYLGIFEDECKKFKGIKAYSKFKTFGAKKYMYGTPEGFKITIAGVPKKKGKACIITDIKKKKLSTPFEVKKGYVFHGIKLTSCFMDHTEVQEFETDEGTVYFASNIAMYPASYTLGLTYDFEVLLNSYVDIMNDFYMED